MPETDPSPVVRTPIKYKPIIEVLVEVLHERERQHDKWGEQNCPSINPEYLGFSDGAARNLRIPSANNAKRQTDTRFGMGVGSWADIALEEFCESIEAAATGTRAQLREELVQTAAVIVSWIEYLDRDRRPTSVVEESAA